MRARCVQDQSARRARNHPRPPADQSRDQPDDKGRVKPDQRIDTRNKGKGHRLWNQSQSNRQAAKHIILNTLDPVGLKLKHNLLSY